MLCPLFLVWIFLPKRLCKKRRNLDVCIYNPAAHYVMECCAEDHVAACVCCKEVTAVQKSSKLEGVDGWRLQCWADERGLLRVWLVALGGKAGCKGRKLANYSSPPRGIRHAFEAVLNDCSTAFEICFIRFCNLFNQYFKHNPRSVVIVQTCQQ